MLPKIHATVGLIFASIIYFIFQISIIEATIIFLASFLTDVDHYFYYIIKEKSWNLKKAYNWFIIKREKLKKLSFKERKKHRSCFLIFHGMEFPILFYIFGFYLHHWFYAISIGMFLHLILDWIELITFKTKFHKFSIIYDYKN